jgi:hypothetical protein
MLKARTEAHRNKHTHTHICIHLPERIEINNYVGCQNHFHIIKGKELLIHTSSGVCENKQNSYKCTYRYT